MARLFVDGVQVEVPDGATILAAAEAAGARVPTLCYEKSVGAITSCMVCLVKDEASGRMLPACSARAADAMRVDTRGDEVRAARRAVLQMLIAEHVGDCEAPCRRVCPASLNIPHMLRLISAGRDTEAAQLAREALIFPATLGRVCTAPCQSACRRGAYDEPLAIRATHGRLGENFAGALSANNIATGKRVAVIGAGLAGLSSAAILTRLGYACTVFEKRTGACAKLLERFGDQLPEAVLEAEIRAIAHSGVELVFNAERTVDQLADDFDAVISTGADGAAGPGVFVAREALMPVRSVALGKAAALEADAFLRDAPMGSLKRLNCQIGKLHERELGSYSVQRRVDDPAAEADRCLGCDCRKTVSCKLRMYAEEYGVDARAPRYMERADVEPLQRFGDVYFETGKCIRCGVCVEICRAAEAKNGLTLARRGLDSRVETPLGALFDDAALAAKCAAACPTGALAFTREEAP